MNINEENIKNKLIKEQDLICLYAINHNNKSIAILENYSHEPSIKYSELKRYLLQDINLLKEFSTKNLLNLLVNVESVTYKGIDSDKIKNDLVEMIMKRLEKEKFFIEDVDNDFFMKPMHSTTSIFSKLGNENLEKIKEKIIERLQKVKGTPAENIARNLRNIGDAANFLKYFEDGIFTQEKIELLEEMLRKDENAFRYMNFGIFKDEIFNAGPKFIEYISKFPKLSTQLVVLQNNNPDLANVLLNRIKEYEILPDNYDEIEVLITYFTKKCFDIKLEKIDENVIDDLVNCAILNSKFNRDKSLVYIDYSENYSEKLKMEYENKYKQAEDFNTKKEIYFNKRFSMSIEEAKALMEDYASDLENIKGISEEDKTLFKEIEDMLNMEDNSDLDELFYNCKDTFKPRDIWQLKHRVAKECAKEYSENMQEVDTYVEDAIHNKYDELVENIEFDGKQVQQINLNGNFELLVHSTDSGFISDQKLEEDADFAKLWASGKDKSNHIISTSYINQDFIGCPPVYKNGVMYGFTAVAPENIKLMGVTDINTFSREFAYSSKERKYMSAKTMPYNSRRVYNEFAIEREGSSPNYVILFDDMNEEVKNNTFKAASQFEIPVLYIDKKEIEQQQIGNLQNLISKFKEEKNPEILKQLLNSYETNIAGWLLNRSEIEEDNTFTADINNSRFKDDFSNIWIEIETTINEYLDTIKKGERQEKSIEDLVKVMQIVLEERELYNKCEEKKPITKTAISFDAKAIIESINQTFDSLGAQQYQIDLEAIPTAKEYKINMKDLIKNALSGKNRVTTDDIKDVENAKFRELESNVLNTEEKADE